MQVTIHGDGENDCSQEIADFLDRSINLGITKHGALCMYTLERDGQAVLMFTDSSDNAITVSQSKQE